MELETIVYEKKDGVAYVTLNRPEKLNAMNDTLHRELGEVWVDFNEDDALKVAILSGNGRCFSAGADLSGEELTVRVLPRQTDEFTCSKCFLVHHRSQLAKGDGPTSVCRECA